MRNMADLSLDQYISDAILKVKHISPLFSDAYYCSRWHDVINLKAWTVSRLSNSYGLTCSLTNIRIFIDREHKNEIYRVPNTRRRCYSNQRDISTDSTAAVNEGSRKNYDSRFMFLDRGFDAYNNLVYTEVLDCKKSKDFSYQGAKCKRRTGVYHSIYMMGNEYRIYPKDYIKNPIRWACFPHQFDVHSGENEAQRTSNYQLLRQLQSNQQSTKCEPPQNDRCSADEDYFLIRIVKSTAFLHLFSGATAGAVSRTLTAPLDRLKVVLQLHPGSRLTVWQAFSTILENERRAFHLPHSKSAFEALVTGWRGFFRGNMTNCIKVVPECALKFYCYDLVKNAMIHLKQQRKSFSTDPSVGWKGTERRGNMHLHNYEVTGIPPESESGSLSFYEKLLCGATAGFFVQLAIYPLELVKTRLAAFSPTCTYEGMFSCLKQTVRQGGIRQLYRGLGPSLLGVIPYAGIDLACFETLKNAYLRRSAKNAATSNRSHTDGESYISAVTQKGTPVPALLVIGAASSLLGQVVAYPTALIRTRIQVDGCDGQSCRYSNSLSVAQQAVKEAGWMGLYRGLGANLFKALPAVSITWIVYEKTKEKINLLTHRWDAERQM